MIAPAALPDLGAYRRFVVAFSGGKDSLAALLHLLSLCVPAHAIELHHHDVDGRGPTFMDWPCTPAYARAIADHLGIALYISWREGGLRITPAAMVRLCATGKAILDDIDGFGLGSNPNAATPVVAVPPAAT